VAIGREKSEWLFFIWPILYVNLLCGLLFQLKQALESGIGINVKFAEGVSPEHEGMTPLALASAYNKLEAAKVRNHYLECCSTLSRVIYDKFDKSYNGWYKN